MRVKPEDEERIRRAGKILNDKVKKYREQFGIDDNQDLLAMVAFDCLIERMKNDEQAGNVDDISSQQLAKLNQMISNAL